MTTTGNEYSGTIVGDRGGTRIGVAGREPRCACDTDVSVKSWTDALARLQAERTARPDASSVGVAVYSPQRGAVRTWIRFGQQGSRAPVALSLGRHPGCDVRAFRDASLRHAIVLAWPEAEQRRSSVLEVLDLRTGMGLVMRGGRIVRHLRSSSLLHFGLGRDEVVIMRAAPRAPFAVELPGELDACVGMEDGAQQSIARRAPQGRADDVNISLVRRGPRGEYTRTMDGSLVSTCQYDIIETSEAELRRGLLLGRYARCDDATRSMSETTSRVHAMVVLRGRHLYAVDVGSTNGTYVVSRSGAVQALLDDVRRVHRLERGESLRIGARAFGLSLATVH